MEANRDQDERGSLSARRVSAECPRDRTVIEARDLTWGISFPLDGDAIIEALSNTLNQRMCPLCKLAVVIPVPLVAFNHLNKQGVVVRSGLVDAGEMKAQIESIGAPSAGIELIEDYAELRAKLLAWVLDYTGALLTVVLTGRTALVDPAERKEQLEPFRLRLLRRFADGRLRVMISVPEPC